MHQHVSQVGTRCERARCKQQLKTKQHAVGRRRRKKLKVDNIVNTGDSCSIMVKGLLSITASANPNTPSNTV
jgi:hypothetical protein